MIFNEYLYICWKTRKSREKKWKLQEELSVVFMTQEETVPCSTKERSNTNSSMKPSKLLHWGFTTPQTNSHNSYYLQSWSWHCSFLRDFNQATAAIFFQKQCKEIFNQHIHLGRNRAGKKNCPCRVNINAPTAWPQGPARPSHSCQRLTD